MVLRCLAIGCVLAVGLQCGCASGPEEPRPRRGTGASYAPSGPFPATRARVSGLTHFDLTADGAWEIVLHLELADRFGDRAKAAGRLTARVIVSDVERSSWSLDLRDPAVNSDYFDPATGTYRVRLTGLTGDVVAVAAGESAVESVLLIVSFETGDEVGDAVLLRDEFLVGRGR